MIPEGVRREIEKEFRMADAARTAGNAGMVRVCARRAAGAAIGCWLADHPRPGWGADAVTRLRGLHGDPGMPAEIRQAAARLTARVTADFRSPYPDDPLEDARSIIRHLHGSDTGSISEAGSDGPRGEDEL